ncbi:MAG: hypothetical protein SFV81_13785 [Pirellulaceae bacterium]|nr:hypothetical protein [Pirellulaceae bacterium]
MAKNDSLFVDDTWIDLKKLALPSGVTASEVEKLLEVKPIKVSLEVILPKGSSAKGFDYSKNADIKKFRSALEAKVAATFAEIVGEDTPEDGKKALDSINSHLEKAVKAFRLVLRTAVAKSVVPSCKPDDLMTAGSIGFEKFEFLFGVKDATDDLAKMLDLTKALKRVKKEQHLGIAWKGKEIVVSVRLRKPFLAADLKDLRSLLPKIASRTNMLIVGEFIAFSKTKVAVNFKEGTKNIPKKVLFRNAFKKQTNTPVVVTVGRMQELDSKKTEKEESEQDQNEKEKSEKDTSAKGTSGKGKPQKTTPPTSAQPKSKKK